MRRKIWLSIAFIILLCAMFPCVVNAAEAETHFGSNYYERTNGESFNIGLYLESEETIGEYELSMFYDTSIMEYVSGAQSGGEGKVTISGDAQSNRVKVLVRFQAIQTGRSTLSISDVYARTPDGEDFVIQKREPVRIAITPVEPTYLSGILINGESLEGFQEDSFDYELTVPFETEQLEVEPVGDDTVKSDTVISDTTLSVGENTITLTLPSGTNSATVYTLHVIREEEVIVAPEPVETEPAVSNEPEEESGTIDGESVEDVIENPPVYDAPEEKSGWHFEENELIFAGLLPITVALIVVISMGICNRRKKRRIVSEGGQDNSEGEWLVWDENSPIIRVEDITMNFRIATLNVSGIKEWVIEKMKKRMGYRDLCALSHISFDIHLGEVVGIIGTNGSGKSTLLKIISGALKPSMGQVVVDRSKIQLLTLGTGFDVEMTARENVYLNGAIIGYSKEFIDEHYDQIVAFAELDGFMEEKVKNFSSGMVSRLGFAIATVGEAAEILILDEVLSVGDEFFRKKSLARIKEMIHGGSTVLLVSHDMSTIKENCSKVVWIEKGEMKMMGTPQEVCSAYQKQGN